jgi:hypothetical protein
VSAQYTVNESFPNGSTVVSDTYVTNPDGSTSETMVDSFGDKVQMFTPGPGTPQANANTINANVKANQATIQAWIAANPAGAVLTGPQTLVLAKMLNGLCNLLLAEFGSTTGT